MSLDIHQREHEGIIVLDLKGRITAGPEAVKLREDVAAIPSHNVVLNLTEVDYIDSTGLGVLVVCATNLRKAGGGLRLVNVNKRQLELLVITKLATVFDLFSDEQDAINSFFPNRHIQTFDILSFVQNMKKEE
ncbi:MAG TPA: STAS domain-containing protein [Bryobacteraceae bacterium]|jgi:anti-sigma B factor antagonist|nr:STAS domain-containing protein [Bryobacteraceae bacterium]